MSHLIYLCHKGLPSSWSQVILGGEAEEMLMLQVWGPGYENQGPRLNHAATYSLVLTLSGALTQKGVNPLYSDYPNE